jgi:sugar phosphate isomerase/epimerase
VYARQSIIKDKADPQKSKEDDMKRKLALGLLGGTGLSEKEQIKKIKEAGFDKVFFDFTRDESLIRKLSAAKELGVPVNSLHAPFMRCDKLWYPTSDTEDVISEQIECLSACKSNGIPTSVHHVFIGFDRHEPTEEGLLNFGRIIGEAERLGVNIAFENTEGIEYFDAVMERYKDSPAVKFCIDTGHELCYNRGRDLISRYSTKLCYTHINDNLGVCGEEITWLDDLHLLPFDGKVDFHSFARRVTDVNYDGDLSFELSRISKPGRHENDGYAEMSFESYLEEAYSRAVKLSELCEKYGLTKHNPIK